MLRTLVLFCLVCYSSTHLAAAQAKGTLDGKVVIQGKIPRLKTSSRKYSPYAALYKEDPAKPASSRPNHLIVYLEGVPGEFRQGKNPVLGQKDKQFTPDIIPVIRGGKVEVTNNDAVQHHIRSSTKPWAFNLKKKGPGETATVSFEGRETGVAPVYCDIHSKMRAHVVVLDNPFYALLEEQGGRFSIKNVPAGTYTLNAFHPTLKFEPFKVSIAKGKPNSVTLNMVGEKE